MWESGSKRTNWRFPDGFLTGFEHKRAKSGLAPGARLA